MNDEFDGGDLPANSEAHSGAPPGKTPAVPSQFGAVSDALNKDELRVLLGLMDKFGVGQDDPLIAGIHILLEARAAAAGSAAAARAATDAAARVESGAAKIPKMILDQTTRSSADIAASLKQAGFDVGQGIVVALKASGIAVSSELRKAALDAQPAIVQEWKGALRKGITSELSRRRAVSWGLAATVAGVSLIVALVAGAVVGRLTGPGAAVPTAPLAVLHGPGITQLMWSVRDAQVVPSQNCQPGYTCVAFASSQSWLAGLL